MISVVIETKDSEEALARTLSSLVGGAVEGVIREVIVCDLGSSDHTHEVAEHAGCTFVSGTAAAGMEQARSDWLMLLEPGARLVDGWIEPVARHMAKATIAARFSRSRSQRRPFLSRILGGNRALVQGILIRRSQAASLARAGVGVEAIARGLATKQLDAEILVAER